MVCSQSALGTTSTNTSLPILFHLPRQTFSQIKFIFFQFSSLSFLHSSSNRKSKPATDQKQSKKGPRSKGSRIHTHIYREDKQQLGQKKIAMLSNTAGTSDPHSHGHAHHLQQPTAHAHSSSQVHHHQQHVPIQPSDHHHHHHHHHHSHHSRQDEVHRRIRFAFDIYFLDQEPDGVFNFI